MYVSKGVSKEEWMWRGLAIVMILALVGAAVIPILQSAKNRYTTVAVLEASQCYRSSQK